MTQETKAIFHVHTNYSRDASITPKQLVDFGIANNIKVMAITDHNEIQGGLETKQIAPFEIIIGEEIQTKEGGEIIGLFLKEKINKEMPVLETIAEIRKQDGLVYLPHPFDRIRRRQFSLKNLESIVEQVDIIETFNARNLKQSANIFAAEFAKKYNKISCVGADAHFLNELETIISLNPFSDKQGLLESLKSAKFQTRSNPIFVHFLSLIFKIKSKL